MKKILMACLLATSIATAQTTAPAAAPVSPAATSLDAFLSQTGRLTVRESYGTKTVPVLYGGFLSLEAVKVYAPGQEASALKGIRMSVRDGDKYSSTRAVFIEFSEVDGMVQAIRYMIDNASKLDAAVQPELAFRSKSEAEVGMFYSTNSKKFLGSASVSTQNVFMELTHLETLMATLQVLSNSLK